MASFPLLRTGAVTQYPSAKSISFPTQVVRYMDGSEQRYRLAAAPIQRWEISMTAVSVDEVAALERFFRDQQGRFGSFAFTDPWTGIEHPDCSFDRDDWEVEMVTALRARTKLLIRDNRS